MKKLFQVLVFLLAANFLAIAGGVGWLFQSHHLDKDKASAIGEIVFPSSQPATQPNGPETQPSATQPSMDFDNLDDLLRRKGQPASEQVEVIQRSIDVQTAELDRRRRELEALAEQLAREQKRLAEAGAVLEQSRKQLNEREQQDQSRASDEGYQESLKLYSSMPAAQVKKIFLGLPEEAVVTYLQAMPPRTASKIIKEFKTKDETDLIHRVLERMRLGKSGPGGETKSEGKPPDQPKDETGVIGPSAPAGGSSASTDAARAGQRDAVMRRARLGELPFSSHGVHNAVQRPANGFGFRFGPWTRHFTFPGAGAVRNSIRFVINQWATRQHCSAFIAKHSRFGQLPRRAEPRRTGKARRRGKGDDPTSRTIAGARGAIQANTSTKVQQSGANESTADPVESEPRIGRQQPLADPTLPPQGQARQTRSTRRSGSGDKAKTGSAQRQAAQPVPVVTPAPAKPAADPTHAAPGDEETSAEPVAQAGAGGRAADADAPGKTADEAGDATPEPGENQQADVIGKKLSRFDSMHQMDSDEDGSGSDSAGSSSSAAQDLGTGADAGSASSAMDAAIGLPTAASAKSPAKPAGDAADGNSFASALGDAKAAAPSTHAAAADAAPAPEARFAEDNHDKIVNGVRSELIPGGGTMQLRLDPPHLGDLRVSVHMQNGVMTAAFETSNDEATRLLSHSLGQLRSMLESQGVSVQKLHVQQAPRSKDAGSNGSRERSQREPTDDQRQSQQREQQRKAMIQKMWDKLAGKAPVDVVA